MHQPKNRISLVAKHFFCMSLKKRQSLNSETLNILLLRFLKSDCFFMVWNFTPKPERNHALKMKWPQFSLWTGNVNFQMMIMHHHSLSAELNNLGVIDAAALCSTPPLWTQMNDTEKRFFKDQKLQSFVEVTYPHEMQHCLCKRWKMYHF